MRPVLAWFLKAINPNLHPERKMVRRKTGKIHQQVYHVGQKKPIQVPPDRRRPDDLPKINPIDAARKFGPKGKADKLGPAPKPRVHSEGSNARMRVALKRRERLADQVKELPIKAAMQHQLKKMKVNAKKQGYDLKGKKPPESPAWPKWRDPGVTPKAASVPVEQASNILDKLIDQPHIRSALALLAGNASAENLGGVELRYLQGQHVIDETGRVSALGAMVIAMFKKWQERQRHDLQSLVGRGVTRSAEYYTPIEAQLAEGEILSAKPKRDGGINTLFEMDLKDEKGETIHVGWKPSDGETDARSGCIDVGTFYRRERAAYEIDRIIGLGLTPPVVIREIDGVVGSCAYWQPGDTAYEALAEGIDWSEDLPRDSIKALAAFDYMLLTDRHANNFLVREESDGMKVYAIDHGYSLPYDDAAGRSIYTSYPHSALDDWGDFKLPAMLREKLRKADTIALKEHLERLGIEEDAIQGFLGRLKYLAEGGELPPYEGV